jgi:hypothetical protein
MFCSISRGLSNIIVHPYNVLWHIIGNHVTHQSTYNSLQQHGSKWNKQLRRSLPNTDGGIIYLLPLLLHRLISQWCHML